MTRTLVVVLAPQACSIPRLGGALSIPFVVRTEPEVTSGLGDVGAALELVVMYGEGAVPTCDGRADGVTRGAGLAREHTTMFGLTGDIPGQLAIQVHGGI